MEDSQDNKKNGYINVKKPLFFFFYSNNVIVKITFKCRFKTFWILRRGRALALTSEDSKRPPPLKLASRLYIC